MAGGAGQSGRPPAAGDACRATKAREGEQSPAAFIFPY